MTASTKFWMVAAATVVQQLLLGCGNTFAFVPNSSSSSKSKSKSHAQRLVPVRPSLTQIQVAPEIIDPSYNLAIGSFGVGLIGGVLEDIKDKDGTKLPTAKLFGAVALIFTLFSAFLTFQTTTLRFTFDDKAFSLVKNDETLSSFDNIKVGGENRWAYSSFQNWDFLPSSDFPILVYFKETQTPEENRAEAPIVVDQKPGQAHFFPAIANTQQLEEGFRVHKCNKVAE